MTEAERRRVVAGAFGAGEMRGCWSDISCCEMSKFQGLTDSIVTLVSCTVLYTLKALHRGNLKGSHHKKGM